MSFKNILSFEAKLLISYLLEDEDEYEYEDKDKYINIEELNHDGSDSYGYKSNLWTLYIFVKEINDYTLRIYHREDWFNCDKKKYRISKVYKVSKLILLEKWHDYLDVVKATSNKQLIDFYEKINNEDKNDILILK